MPALSAVDRLAVGLVVACRAANGIALFHDDRRRVRDARRVPDARRAQSRRQCLADLVRHSVERGACADHGGAGGRRSHAARPSGRRCAGVVGGGCGAWGIDDNAGAPA